MNQSALLQSDIDSDQQSLDIFKDCLNYALKNNLIFDIEHYSNLIQLTEKRIGAAELKLYRLKMTS